MDEIGYDIKRIRAIESDNTLTERIRDFSEYQLYGVILADVWSETVFKKEILSSFETKMFTETYAKELDLKSELHDVYYNLESFGRNETLQKYKLVSMIWKI